MRTRWVDSWKGILIFLVVLGHVVGMVCHYTQGETSKFMSLCYKWIYLFHMPAFFVVVGYINRTQIASRYAQFVAKRAKRLLVPYFFWGVVSIVVFLTMTAVMGGLQGTDRYYGARMIPKDWWQPFVSLLHAGGWPRGEGFRCNSVLWFLPTMFCTLIAWRLVAGCQWLVVGGERKTNNQQLTTNNYASVLLAVAFLVIGGVMRFYVGRLPWGLDKVPRFLAFVYVGEVVASCEVSRFLGFRVSEVSGLQGFRSFKVSKFQGFKVSRLLSLGVFVICAVVLTWGAMIFPDRLMAFRSWQWYLVEAGLAVVGSVMTLVLARLVDCRLLAWMGIASLGIMVTHKFPIVFLQSVIGKFGWFRAFERFETLAVAVGIAVVVTAVSWAVARLVRRWAPWSC